MTRTVAKAKPKVIYKSEPCPDLAERLAWVCTLKIQRARERREAEQAEKEAARQTVAGERAATDGGYSDPEPE